MSILWFFIGVIILIVILLTRKSSHSPGNIQGGAGQYSQGYWDGYRAFGKKVQAELGKEAIDRDALQHAIDEGYGVTPASTISEYVQPTVAIPADQISQIPQQSSLRNLNVILYMASFLFVAAVAALIATAMPDGVKLVSVWLLAILFYGVGYTLYVTMPNLRPAAIAFLGTGMAIIPFAGFALDQYSNIGGDWAWLITSLVGLVAYYAAAVRLQNQLVSYLTMAFVLSLVSSTVATVSAPMVWYFVLLIGVSLAASIISLARPAWISELFKRPVETTGQWVTPLALLASLFVITELSLLNYEILFAIATAHYLVAWLQSHKFSYETAARVLTQITALLVGWDITDGVLVPFGFVFLTLSVAQLAYSLVRVTRPGANLLYEKIWMYGAIVLQLVSTAFWGQSDSQDILSVISLSVIVISSILFALRLRHVPVLVFGLVASLVIPIIVTYGIVEPALDPRWLAAWYGLVAIVILSVWSKLRIASAGFIQFSLASFLSYVVAAGLVASSMPEIESAIVLLLLGVILWTGSYVIQKPALSALGNFGVIVSMLNLGQWLNIESDWKIIAPMLVLALIFYYGYWLMIELGDGLRRQIQLIFTWTVLAIGILAGYFVDSTELVSALMVVAAAATLGIEGWRAHKPKYIEIAIYIATFGLQRALEVMFPELNTVFYAHWWAITIVAVGLWRRSNMRTRLIVGMGFVTLATGIFALSEGGVYQLLFLVEHIVLLVAGVLMHRTWATWWGISASTLAILWFLRDYSFLALGFLGLVLIGIVVWRLVRANGK